MNKPTSDVEQLREEMRRLRSHMDADVDSFVENTRDLFNWHSYFQKVPWLCLGAAALTGYLLIPSKSKSVTVDLEKLLELAKHRQVTVTEQAVPAKGAAPTLGKMVVGLLWRTALSVATQQLNQILTPRGPTSGPPHGDPSQGSQAGSGSSRPAAGGGR
jgi:hypothetical protein